MRTTFSWPTGGHIDGVLLYGINDAFTDRHNAIRLAAVAIPASPSWYM